MFDTSLRERLNREGYRYLFEGMEQINIQLTLGELKFHVTSYGTAPLLWISNNKTYQYKMNEAVIFGDGFEHATEPYSRTDSLRVMLSFTFGTDKIEYWDTLKQTIGEQSNYMILPCGHQKGTCKCLN